MSAQWLTTLAAAKALGVSLKSAYRIAYQEQWTKKPGARPTQYLWRDIRRTAVRRRRQ